MKLAVAATLFAALQNTHAAPLPAGNDLWDVTQGTIVTSNSSVHPVSNIGNMFGANLGTVELGHMLFADNPPAGFVDFVEWKTLAPVTIGQVNLFAVHDPAGITNRGFSRFTLKAFNSSSGVFDTVLSFTPTSPYTFIDTGSSVFNSGLLVSQSIGPVTAQNWRAEFVQAGPPSSAAGPRILELDGLAPVPLPMSVMFLGPGIFSLGIMGRRRNKEAS